MEATRETLQRCLVLALTPVLNQMSVMGVVSIPGMMTGQILGGTSPSQVHCSQLAFKSQLHAFIPACLLLTPHLLSNSCLKPCPQSVCWGVGPR